MVGTIDQRDESLYNTMTIGELVEFKVPTAPIIYMWVTWPKLNEAFTLLSAWGYTFRGVELIWLKRGSKGSQAQVPTPARGGHRG